MNRRKTNGLHRNTLSMAKTAEISARFDVSAEATAAICNAHLVDMGHQLEEIPDQVVSSNTQSRFPRN